MLPSVKLCCLLDHDCRKVLIYAACLQVWGVVALYRHPCRLPRNWIRRVREAVHQSLNRHRIRHLRESLRRIVPEMPYPSLYRSLLDRCPQHGLA